MEPGSAAQSDASVARILRADGRPEGAGFRAGQREVITCAHVVAKAFGLQPDIQELPEGRIWVDFPLAERGTRVAARVGAWSPVRSDGSGDIAVLELLTEPPAKAPIARLVEDAVGPDRRVRAFGFPHRYDDGAWSVGWLRGATGAGWLQYDTDPASEHRVEQGFSGAPVWDVAEGGIVGMVVAAEARADVRTAYLIPVRTLRESWSALAATALPACPFRSLEPFGERDADLFHGRDEPAARITGLLGHAPATSLVGPSGSGKSSLLYAGVLPRLRERPELEIVVFRPGRVGHTPLHALALALLPRLETELTETARLAQLPELTELLRGGQLPAVVERLLARQGKQRLLVIADQFEEALIGTAPAELDALAAALAYSLHPGSRMQLVTSLRADFLTPALSHPGLAPLFAGDRLFTVGAMSDAELRAAVEMPLSGTGVMYEPGLVDRILGDVGRDPGRLPLLEFALTKLWERQRHGRIGHAAYESLGRVHDALVTHAEQIWTGTLDQAEQRAARALLVQLVHPGDDGIASTRRTLARSELRGEQWRLAQRLMTTRLLVPGEEYRPDAGPPEETVELAHETLLTQWDRLRTYITQDRDFRMWQEGLRRRISLWSADTRPGRRLLRGQELQDARRWHTTRTAELRPAEEAFIEASGKGARRRLTKLTGLGLVIALLAGMGIWWWRTDISHDAASKASDVLVQQSRDAEMGDNPGDFGSSYTSLLLALRAYRTQDTPRTRARLGEMHARYGFADLLAPRYTGIGSLPVDVLHIPTGSIADAEAGVVAALTSEGKLVILSAGPAGVRRTATGSTADVTAVSPDGTMVALADLMTMSLEQPESDPQRMAARLLDVRTGKIRELEAPQGGDPIPEDLDKGGEIPGFEMPDLPTFPGLTLPTQYARLAFDPESEVLLGQTGAFGHGGRLVLWDPADGRIKKVMPGLPEAVDQLWLGAGGDRLFTMTDQLPASLSESTVVVKSWDLTGDAPVGREVLRRRTSLTHVVNMDVSPDLTRLLLVETETGTERAELSHRIAVHELPGGQLLHEERSAQQVGVDGISVGSGGSPVLVYSLAGQSPNEPPPGNGPIRTIGGRQVWSGVELTGPAGRPSLVLESMGVVAVVRPGDGDALSRLPALTAKTDKTPAVAETKRWMTRLCRILGDETLPTAVNENVPPGAYRGPLCKGGNGTRG